MGAHLSCCLVHTPAPVHRTFCYQQVLLDGGSGSQGPKNLRQSLNDLQFLLQEHQSTRNGLYRHSVASPREQQSGHCWLGWAYQILGLGFLAVFTCLKCCDVWLSWISACACIRSRKSDEQRELQNLVFSVARRSTVKAPSCPFW